VRGLAWEGGYFGECARNVRCGLMEPLARGAGPALPAQVRTFGAQSDTLASSCGIALL